MYIRVVSGSIKNRGAIGWTRFNGCVGARVWCHGKLQTCSMQLCILLLPRPNRYFSWSNSHPNPLKNRQLCRMGRRQQHWQSDSMGQDGSPRQVLPWTAQRQRLDSHGAKRVNTMNKVFIQTCLSMCLLSMTEWLCVCWWLCNESYATFLSYQAIITLWLEPIYN